MFDPVLALLHCRAIVEGLSDDRRVHATIGEYEHLVGVRFAVLVGVIAHLALDVRVRGGTQCRNRIRIVASAIELVVL